MLRHCWLGGRKGIWLVKNMGGWWRSVPMEWRPAELSVCLPLLIFPCIIKSRSSLLAPAHLGGPGKRAVKRLWCGGVALHDKGALKLLHCHCGRFFWPIVSPIGLSYFCVIVLILVFTTSFLTPWKSTRPIRSVSVAVQRLIQNWSYWSDRVCFMLTLYFHQPRPNSRCRVSDRSPRIHFSVLFLHSFYVAKTLTITCKQSLLISHLDEQKDTPRIRPALLI